MAVFISSVWCMLWCLETPAKTSQQWQQLDASKHFSVCMVEFLPVRESCRLCADLEFPGSCIKCRELPFRILFKHRGVVLVVAKAKTWAEIDQLWFHIQQQLQPLLISEQDKLKPTNAQTKRTPVLRAISNLMSLPRYSPTRTSGALKNLVIRQIISMMKKQNENTVNYAELDEKFFRNEFSSFSPSCSTQISKQSLERLFVEHRIDFNY